MYLGKVITAIGVLNKKQLSRFESYVASPYFEVPQATRNLFAYLRAHYPLFDEKKIQPAVIAKKDKTLRSEAIQKKAGSELLKALEHFLALEEWQQGPYEVPYYKAKALHKVHLFDAFEKEVETAEKELAENKEQDITVFWYRHLFTELRFNAFHNRIPGKKLVLDIAPVLKTLDEFKALKAVRYLCEALSRHAMFGVKPPAADTERFITTLQPYTNHNYPYVNLFVNVLRMISATTYTESRKYYLQLKKEVESNDVFPLPQSIKEVNTYGRQWATYWGNRGYFDAREEYLWWVELLRKHDLLLNNGKITPFMLVNTVSNAVQFNKPSAWIKKFVDAYAAALPADKQEYADFVRGLHAYSAKKYTEAVRYLRMAQQKDDAVFNVVLRRWEFIVLYEAGDTDAGQLLNHLEAYRKYVARHAVEMHGLEGQFEKFIQYATLLVKGKLGTHKGFTAEMYFTGKEWLEGKTRTKALKK